MTALSGLAVQVGRPLVSILTLPLLLGELGDERFGLWLIAVSVLGILSFVGTGISSSVITYVGRMSASEDTPAMSQIATVGLVIAIACAALLMLIGLPVALLSDWVRILKLEDASLGVEVGRLLAAIIAVLGISFVAVIPRQVMFGRMHGYLAHLLDFAGILLGAAGLILATLAAAPLWVMAVLFVAPSMLLVFFGGLFYLSNAGISPFALGNMDRTMFRAFRGDAVRMSGYQMAFTVSSQTDLILIGLFLGSAATVAFGVAQRVFSLFVLVGYTFNQAQWPALARADAAGERSVLVPLFRRTLVLVPLCTSVLSLLVVYAYDPLMQLYLGETLQTDALILWGMVSWVFVATCANTCDVLLRARNETSFLMKTMGSMAIVNLTLTVLLIPQIGPAGAIWGSVMSYFFAVLIPYLWRLRSMIFEPQR